MPNVQFDWTSIKRDWAYELDRLGIQQQEVAKFIGVSDVIMTRLVKAMTDGKGLTASALDHERWQKAIEYVQFKENQAEEVK